MIAAAFHDCFGTGVPDTEALTGFSANEGLAGRCSIQGHIADDDIVLRHKPAVILRLHDQSAPREALAEIIVGISGQPVWNEGTE